jgi:hypothetical protein
MDELVVLTSNHLYITNNNSMYALAISVFVGLALIKIMDAPRFAQYRIITMLIVMFAINIGGLLLDRQERIAADTPRCNTSLQAKNGEIVELNYKIQSNQSCFAKGKKIVRIKMPGGELPKGTLYLENGVGNTNSAFIQ